MTCKAGSGKDYAAKEDWHDKKKTVIEDDPIGKTEDCARRGVMAKGIEMKGLWGLKGFLIEMKHRVIGDGKEFVLRNGLETRRPKINNTNNNYSTHFTKAFR